MKCFSNGFLALGEMCRLAKLSTWVGLGSFGLHLECDVLKHLPKHSHLIIGTPREVGPASTQVTKLRLLKKTRPDLIICAYEGFHAKYGLFRTKNKVYTMGGSYNLTNSPAEEWIVFSDDIGLYEALSKRHERWLLNGKLVEAYEAKKLDKAGLASLSSKPV